MQLHNLTAARHLHLLGFILIFSTAVLAASHAPNPAGKRLLPSQHKPGTNVPRRPHPFPEELEKQRRSGASLLTRIFGSSKSTRKSKRHAKKNAKLGPGPGYAASFEAWKRSQAQKAESEKRPHQNSKRQSNSSASATPTSSGAAATPTSDAPVWLLDDVYEGNKFFPYVQPWIPWI